MKLKLISSLIEYLHQKTDFSADQLGLPEDFCIPLPAAVVELAALDHHTTPLDRMTCIYDTVQQIGAHIRQAVLDTHADSDDIRSKLTKVTMFEIYYKKSHFYKIDNCNLIHFWRENSNI